jgi:MFS family permease
MFTYVTTTTVPSFPLLQELYGLTADQVNWTVAIPALGLAVGPLFWSSPADIVGRRVVMLAGTVIALAASAGCARAPSYGAYMAARFFQGFGVSPAATVGLAVINDVFFEHVRGQKIGFWVLAIDMGIYFGPLLGGFLTLAGVEWPMWLTAILFAAILAAELLFLPETLYPRNRMLAAAPRRASVVAGFVSTATRDEEKVTAAAAGAFEPDLKRTTGLPFVNVVPVPGLRHPKVWDTPVRFIKTFKFAVVPITVFVFCFGWYWFLISVLTMVPFAYPQFSPQIQG